MNHFPYHAIVVERPLTTLVRREALKPLICGTRSEKRVWAYGVLEDGQA